MTTVNSLVTSALRKINAIDSNEPIQDADFESIVDALNRMVMRWEADGTSVGWTPVANPGDIIPCPIEAENAIIYNLAIDQAPEFGQTPSPIVIRLAESYMASLERDVFNAMSMRVNTNAPGTGWGGVWNMYTDGPN